MRIPNGRNRNCDLVWRTEIVVVGRHDFLGWTLARGKECCRLRCCCGLAPLNVGRYLENVGHILGYRRALDVLLLFGYLEADGTKIGGN